MAIKVSKQIHNYIGQIVRILSEKVGRFGYSATTLQPILDTKIGRQGLVNMALSAWDANLPANHVADNIVKLLGLQQQ
jgi:hypothetical protein